MADDVKSLKGKPCKVVDGFTMLYQKDSTNGLRKYWRCSSAAADLPPDKFVLPEPMKRTLRERRFLLADTSTTDPGKPRILVFASEYGIDLLKENPHWCIDGTFFSAPKHYDNLLTINTFVGKSSLPAAFILMPGRSEELYNRAFDALFGTEQLKDVTPTTYITDMEKALTNALESRFPDATGYLCLFHLAKACFGRVQKKLLDVYTIPAAKELLRCYVALALLPPEEVIDGYKDIVRALDKLVEDKVVATSFKQPLKDYADYFARTYIGVKRNGRLERARFPRELWNCFQRTLDGIARTNNAIEGWHFQLNTMFPKAHMPMSQWIVRVQKEEERTYCLGVRHAVNPGENLRGRASDNSVRENNLRALVQQYSDTPVEQRDRLDYLTKVQYHLSKAAFLRILKENEDDNAATPSSSQSSMPSQSTQAFVEDYVDLACLSAAPSATANVTVGRPLEPFSFFD